MSAATIGGFRAEVVWVFIGPPIGLVSPICKMLRLKVDFKSSRFELEER